MQVLHDAASRHQDSDSAHQTEGRTEASSEAAVPTEHDAQQTPVDQQTPIGHDAGASSNIEHQEPTDVQRPTASASEAAAVVCTDLPGEQPGDSRKPPASAAAEALLRADGSDSLTEVRAPPACTKLRISTSPKTFMCTMYYV